VNANDIHQFMPKSNLAISTSLPPTKCKSLELRSNCTSDCILDYALDIKPSIGHQANHNIIRNTLLPAIRPMPLSS
jgi:hypothetical protein